MCWLPAPFRSMKRVHGLTHPLTARYGAGTHQRDGKMAKLTLGYKASAEQFAPKDLLEFGIAAEQNGFDSVVVSDHYQPWNHTDGHAPHSFTWLAALGQRTSTVKLGTSVVT